MYSIGSTKSISERHSYSFKRTPLIMQNMLKRESSTAEGSAAPKTRVVMADRDQERELLKITTRLALLTDNRVRTLMSLVYNARFRTDSEVIQAMKTTTDDYIANQKKKKMRASPTNWSIKSWGLYMCICGRLSC